MHVRMYVYTHAFSYMYIFLAPFSLKHKMSCIYTEKSYVMMIGVDYITNPFQG